MVRGVGEVRTVGKGEDHVHRFKGAGTGPVGVKAAGNSAPQSIVIVFIG